jgi:hypothetical protein
MGLVMRTRKIEKPLAALILASAMMISLAGCAPSQTHGVRLSPDETQLPKCAASTKTNVEDLGLRPRASCDLDGTNIQFPDGTEVTAPPVGGSTGHQSFVGESGTASSKLGLINLGVYGIVAIEKKIGGEKVEWGTKEGLKKVKDAHVSI